jgi:hypothetical protein
MIKEVIESQPSNITSLACLSRFKRLIRITSYPHNYIPSNMVVFCLLSQSTLLSFTSS